MNMRATIEIDVPHRHVDRNLQSDWFAVDVHGHALVVNEAGEGGVTTYTIDSTTRNPRVMATAEAILWEGIVGITHYEDDTVTISHQFAGVEDWVHVDEWLDEPVPTLERTDLVDLKGVGGTVEFDCIDCGEHIKRYRNQMDVPGLTPQRCTSCTFDRMAESSTQI